LIDYSNQHNIILKINEKDCDDCVPLVGAIVKSFTEEAKLIIDYANSKGITIKFTEKDLKTVISKGYKNSIKNISEINMEILKLLYINRNNHKIEIEFDDPSELLNKLTEASKFVTNVSTNAINSTTLAPSSSIPPLSSDNVNKITNTPTEDLVLVLYDYNSILPGELTIRKNEYLVVTDWNVKEGWAYGYKKNNPNEKGIFLIPLISKSTSNTDKSKSYSQQNPATTIPPMGYPYQMAYHPQNPYPYPYPIPPNGQPPSNQYPPLPMSPYQPPVQVVQQPLQRLPISQGQQPYQAKQIPVRPPVPIQQLPVSPYYQPVPVQQVSSYQQRTQGQTPPISPYQPPVLTTYPQQYTYPSISTPLRKSSYPQNPQQRPENPSKNSN